MSDAANFVGRGVSFPLRVDQSGSIAFTTGGADIDGSLRMILMTAPGERLMRPQFGCRIWDLLFEPVNANTIGLMSEAVRDAVSQWEPRVDLDEVTIDHLVYAMSKQIENNFQTFYSVAEEIVGEKKALEIANEIGKRYGGRGYATLLAAKGLGKKGSARLMSRWRRAI